MAINLKDILDYVTPEPRYTGELKNLGLITAGDLEKARNQSIFQGLLGTGLSYLAQPKNMGYGSALPYLAKAGMAGLQASERPYERLKEDVLMKEKLREMAREKTKRETVEAVLKDGLYKETTTGGELKEAYKPVTQKTYTPSGLVDTAVAPSFKAPEYTPTKTTYDFDLGQIQKLIQSNALPEAGALMNLEKARRELLKTNQTGMLLTDAQAKSIGLRVDKNQKYFLNDKGKPELIQGQMLTDSEINKDDYQLVMNPEGTFYVPKQPSKTKVPLQLVEGGKYIERPDFTQYQDPDIKIFNKEQVMPMVLSLQADYPNLDAENAVNVILQVMPRAYDYKKSAEGKRDPRNLYDIVKDMVVSQYNVSEKGIVFKEPALTSKPEFKIGSIVEDASGKRVRITGFDNTNKPTYVEVQ